MSTFFVSQVSFFYFNELHPANTATLTFYVFLCLPKSWNELRESFLKDFIKVPCSFISLSCSLYQTIHSRIEKQLLQCASLTTKLGFRICWLLIKTLMSSKGTWCMIQNQSHGTWKTDLKNKNKRPSHHKIKMRNVSNNDSKYTGPHPLLIGITRALEFHWLAFTKVKVCRTKSSSTLLGFYSGANHWRLSYSCLTKSEPDSLTTYCFKLVYLYWLQWICCWTTLACLTRAQLRPLISTGNLSGGMEWQQRFWFFILGLCSFPHLVSHHKDALLTVLQIS